MNSLENLKEMLELTAVFVSESKSSVEKIAKCFTHLTTGALPKMSHEQLYKHEAQSEDQSETLTSERRVS